MGVWTGAGFKIYGQNDDRSGKLTKVYTSAKNDLSPILEHFNIQGISPFGLGHFFLFKSLLCIVQLLLPAQLIDIT